MKIYWKDKKLKDELEDIDFLNSNYDKKVAKNVAKRLREIGSFPSYADLPPNTKKHSIKDGRKFLYFSVDLPGINNKRGKWRLIFIPLDEYDMSNQKSITSVKILGIKDTHK
jgi:hypothetical protein